MKYTTRALLSQVLPPRLYALVVCSLLLHETRKAGFLAVKSSFRFLKEIPAYAAEKPGFLPPQAEDTFFARFLVSCRLYALPREEFYDDC